MNTLKILKITLMLLVGQLMFWKVLRTIHGNGESQTELKLARLQVEQVLL